MRAVVPTWSRLVFAAAILGPGAAAAGEFPAPIDLSGAVTYTIQNLTRADGERSLQQAGTLSVNPSTYFYEPWLVSMTSQLNMTKTMSSGSTESGSGILTGSVTFNVLPQSEHPVELFYSRYNRDVQLGEDFAVLTGQSYRVASQYLMSDDWSLNGRVSGDQAEDDEGMAENSNEILFEVDKLIAEDHLRVSALHRESVYESSDEEMGGGNSSNDSVALRYRSHPFDTVTTDSTSTLRTSTYEDASYTGDTTSMQGVTTAVWRPVELNKDLTVHGAMRTFQQSSMVTSKIDDQVTKRESTTAFGTLATTYIFEPRLIGSAGLNAGYMDTRDENPGAIGSDTGSTNITAMSTGGNGALDYSSEVSNLYDFNWSWNTGGSLETAFNNQLGMTHSEAARVGHTGNRKIDLLFTDDVNFSASQTTGMTFQSINGAGIPLSHSATFSQQNRFGKSWNYWNLSATDSRQFGGSGALYQLINMQLTEGYDPDRFSTLSASLNFQASRQAFATEDTGFVDTINGQITYRERNVFGMENLGFTSDLTFNPPSVIRTRREQDFASTSGQYGAREGNVFGTQRWSNRLDYYIGQLRASLTGRVINGEDGLSHMMMFQGSRRF